MVQWANSVVFEKAACFCKCLQTIWSTARADSRRMQYLDPSGTPAHVMMAACIILLSIISTVAYIHKLWVSEPNMMQVQ